MVTFGGGNRRMVIMKDMEHTRELLETDTLGNTVMITNTDMEYSDSMMEQYITDSGKMINTMGKDIRESLTEMSTGESSRMATNGETEYPKRMECSTKTNIRKATASAEVKFNEVL
jgi:hypothetical protein